VSVTIFLEGGSVGPHSKALNTECRRGFRELIQRCGYERLPSLVACGSRSNAFRDFKKDVGVGVAFLWVDSEDPVSDIEDSWVHLKARDGWKRPKGALNEHVLLMTTCMETLIAADRAVLREHYGPKFQESALPPVENIEKRLRHDVQEKLIHATRKCSNPHSKGKRSFEVVGKLNPITLEQLPSFKRTRRILDTKL
jgi:hypothetical protein